jgi:hypothetical protein
MESKKQSPIDWLIEQLTSLDKEIDGTRKSEDSTVLKLNPTKLYEKAKQMERDALFNCWVASHEAYMTSENYREKKEFDKYYQKNVRAVKKQTAVISLLKELHGDNWSVNVFHVDFANKYLEMEKAQIIDAYDEGVGDGASWIQDNTEDPKGQNYFNQTYKQ